MMAAAPRRRTSGTSTAANDEADGSTAALVVVQGGDHKEGHEDDREGDNSNDNMERVFAFDYDVLYKDFVRSNIILLTIWGLYGALGLSRVVAYYSESRAMEKESATLASMTTYDDELPTTQHQLQHDTMDKVAVVFNGLGAVCFLFLLVYTVGTLSQRWRMEAEQRLVLTTTGVRMDYPFNPLGRPLTIHVRGLCRWPPFLGDFLSLLFSSFSSSRFVLLHTYVIHTNTQIPYHGIQSIQRQPPPRCCSCLRAAASQVILHFGTKKKSTTIAGLVEPDEFVSLVQRRMEVAKDHHHSQEKAAYCIMA
jgi:hypothetical protein